MRFSLETGAKYELGLKIIFWSVYFDFLSQALLILESILGQISLTEWKIPKRLVRIKLDGPSVFTSYRWDAQRACASYPPRVLHNCSCKQGYPNPVWQRQGNQSDIPERKPHKEGELPAEISQLEGSQGEALKTRAIWSSQPRTSSATTAKLSRSGSSHAFNQKGFYGQAQQQNLEEEARSSQRRLRWVREGSKRLSH